MRLIGFYLSLPFIYFVAILPDGLRYLFSDVFSIFIAKVMGYRKKVIKDILTKSFPNKSASEIDTLMGKYYHHFTDIVFESFKQHATSPAKMKERIQIKNPELLEAFRKDGKSILLLISHHNNWEWFGSSFSLHTAYKGGFVYKVLKNPHFENFLSKVRSKYGMQPVPMKAVNQFLKSIDEPTVLIMASDQWPANPDKQYWTTFLNQDTPVFLGAERFAVIYDLPMVFGKLSKVKRGYYEMKFETISDDPKSAEKGSLTEKYTRLLDSAIMNEPAHWIWSHKRWKNSKSELGI